MEKKQARGFEALLESLAPPALKQVSVQAPRPSLRPQTTIAPAPVLPPAIDPGQDAGQTYANLNYMAARGMDPKQKALSERLIAQLQARAGEQDALVKKAESDPGDQGFDLNMLAKIVDLWTNGDTAKNFTARITPEQRANYIMQLKKQSGDAAMDVTKAQLGYLKELNDSDLGWAKIGGSTKKPEKSQIKEIMDFDRTMHQVDALSKAMRPEYLGPMSDWSTNKWAKQAFDPKRVEFLSRIGRIADVYRKNITGSQAAMAELQKIESRLPEGTDTPEQFKAKAAGVIRDMKHLKRIYLQDLAVGGVDVRPWMNNIETDQEASTWNTAKQEAGFSPEIEAKIQNVINHNKSKGITVTKDEVIAAMKKKGAL